MLILDEIKNVSHVVIVCDNDSFCRASALYTYVLQQHKKVSLLSREVLDVRFAFVAWFDKVRMSAVPEKAQCVVDAQNINISTFLEEEKIVLNQKMLDALCADLVWYGKYTPPTMLDGIYFASLSRLIQRGANYTQCTKALLCQEPLSKMRLQAVMQQKMMQKNGATEVEVFLSEEDLLSTGSSIREAYENAQKILCMVHVDKVSLVYCNEVMTIT